MTDSTLQSSELSVAALNQALAGYEIVREVGHGSMGVVYEARQEGVGRRVAIKVLPPNMALRERTVKRFLREAEAMGRLSHSNIVDIHEVGSIGSLHYFSMKFVEGPPLDRVLRAGPLAIRDVIEIGIDVANALAHAHSRGVLHRDVKPSNLLRDGERVVLTDFGLARPLDQEEAGTMTESGDMVGTPLYMSPEQISGVSDKVDGRSDVWGLGATLYELLTQRPPFQGANAQTILNGILHKDPPLLHKLRDDVPRDLEAVLLKCLEKDVSRRYATAAGLVEDLIAVRDGKPVSARPPRFFDPVVRWVRRNPIEAGVGVGLLVIATVFALNWRSSATKIETAQQEQKTAERKRDEFKAATTLASARSELLQVQMQWQSGGEREKIEARERLFTLIDSFQTRDPAIALEGLEVFARWGHERAVSDELALWIDEFRRAVPDATGNEVAAFSRWILSAPRKGLDERIRKREQAVIDLFESGLIARQDPARALQYRAAIFAGLGRMEESLRVDALAARSSPRDPAPFLAAARTHIKLGMQHGDRSAANDARRSFTLALNAAAESQRLAILASDENATVNALIEHARAELALERPEIAVLDLQNAGRRDETRAAADSLLRVAQRQVDQRAHGGKVVDESTASAATPQPKAAPSVDAVVEKFALQATKSELETAARGVQSIYNGLRGLLSAPQHSGEESDPSDEPAASQPAATAPGEIKKP